MKQPAMALSRDPWSTRTVRIAEIQPEVENVATYRLVLEGPVDDSAYEFAPGQFNMLYLPGVGEAAISMSGTSTSPDSWIHTVRAAGNVTQSLARLRPPDTLGLRGPFGTGWPIADLFGNDIVIVAGGLGMAPLRPLVYYIIHNRDQFGTVWLISGSRTPETLLYATEYDSWKQHDINVMLTVDRATSDWQGLVGVVTLLVERLQLPRVEMTQLVACGPEVMMKYTAATGLRQGIAAERIWLSLERNMQCAVGHCGHCQLGPDFICKDGPVLQYDRLRPHLFVEHL